VAIAERNTPILSHGYDFLWCVLLSTLFLMSCLTRPSGFCRTQHIGYISRGCPCLELWLWRTLTQTTCSKSVPFHVLPILQVTYRYSDSKNLLNISAISCIVNITGHMQIFTSSAGYTKDLCIIATKCTLGHVIWWRTDPAPSSLLLPNFEQVVWLWWKKHKVIHISIKNDWNGFIFLDKIYYH
jgi:hypothetical protein